jgi:DUF2934 family protein
MARVKTDERTTTAADRAPSVLPDRAATVTDGDIARRAFELYCGRDCQHGHDVEDWLRAEQELRETAYLTAV